MSRLAYKLLRLRADGSLGPLFINRRQRIPVGEWLEAESHPTKGFAIRPGWHCCDKPLAPHLSKKGRVWALVHIMDETPHQRPESQGGLWFTASWMCVQTVLGGREVIGMPCGKKKTVKVVRKKK